MKLDQLREIAKTVSKELHNDGLISRAYYFFGGKWIELSDGSAPLPVDVTHALSRSQTEPVAYHPSKSRTAWFHLPADMATLAVEFPSSPKLKTCEQVRRRIGEIREHAINAFKVTHHELTGLISRDAFRESLRNAMLDLNGRQPKGFVLASEGQPLGTVSVLAFDIDKFKQVNDTYGHIYGDQVLKSFAWRLEATAESLIKEMGASTRILVGHPSGEEFLALVEGNLTNDELTQIAERFRLCIADEPLPSDTEWERLSENTELEKVRLPAKSERTITTSIGVASYSGSAPPDKSAPLVLLDKADTALYKSKSSGRNRITRFEDILQQCGRVLEHDPSTGVVAVDIGSKVGVLVGQEFRVFPPTYCGSTAFTVDDGRTRRTLGVYPKVELCRVVVFNSQSDVSFGYVVSQTSTGKPIPHGAILEAVPLGSITHLIERPQSTGVAGVIQEPQTVIGGNELQEHIDQLISAGVEPFAAVVRFKLENDFHKKYGSAAVNRALAQLFSRVRGLYSHGQRIGLIDTTAICVVGEKSTFSVEDLENLFGNAYPTPDELEPICGYYMQPKPTAGGSVDAARQSAQDHHAIELARYALSDSSGFEQKRVQAFSTTIAERILTQHRKARSYGAGITDYNRLREIGVTSADFENIGGLCYSAAGDFPQALECYLRAMELQPASIIFRGNVGILAHRLGQVDLGLEVLSEIRQEKIESLKKLHPAALWSYAVLLAEAKQANSHRFDPQRMKHVGELACEIEGASSKPGYSTIRAAIDATV